MKESGRGTIYVLSSYLPRGHKYNHEKCQSGQVSGQVIVPATSNTRHEALSLVSIATYTRFELTGTRNKGDWN